MSRTALVLGESLTDVVVGPTGVTAEYPGGSPMNVAIGLARLGLAVELHTAFGSDVRGERILSELLSSGVRVSPASLTPASTSTSTAFLAADGGATYQFNLSSSLLPYDSDADVDLVHTGSIGAVLQPGASAIRAVLERAAARSTITYDPNIRPGIMGTPEEVRPVVEALVRLSDVVKVSDEDLKWLYPDGAEAAIGRWMLEGPAIVVHTLGADGSIAYAGPLHTRIAGVTVDVADTIGAGDSFMAGLIVALGDVGLLGASHRPLLRAIGLPTLRAVVEFASQCAGVTVTRSGANPPTRAELTRELTPLDLQT